MEGSSGSSRNVSGEKRKRCEDENVESPAAKVSRRLNFRKPKAGDQDKHQTCEFAMN